MAEVRVAFGAAGRADWKLVMPPIGKRIGGAPQTCPSIGINIGWVLLDQHTQLTVGHGVALTLFGDDEVAAFAPAVAAEGLTAFDELTLAALGAL